VTRKLPLEVLPASSLAVHVTVVIPIRKVLPDGGEHDTVGVGSMLSVAVTVNVTIAPFSRPVACLMRSPGSVKTGAIVSTGVLVLKVAVTDRAPLMNTVHVLALPAHAPLQPVKTEPLAAVAVSVTVVPLV
jgi:hypothetical protein